MNACQANSANLTLKENSKENNKSLFNRKPDLTYDLEIVLAKLNIEIEVSN